MPPFPFVCRVWGVLCDQDGGGGNVKKLFIGHGEFRPGKFALGIFKVVDVLRGPFGLLVETDHFHRKIDKFTGVKAAAVVFQGVNNVIAVTLL